MDSAIHCRSVISQRIAHICISLMISDNHTTIQRGFSLRSNYKSSTRVESNYLHVHTPSPAALMGIRKKKSARWWGHIITIAPASALFVPRLPFFRPSFSIFSFFKCKLNDGCGCGVLLFLTRRTFFCFSVADAACEIGRHDLWFPVRGSFGFLYLNVKFSNGRGMKVRWRVCVLGGNLRCSECYFPRVQLVIVFDEIRPRQKRKLVTWKWLLIR